MKTAAKTFRVYKNDWNIEASFQNYAVPKIGKKWKSKRFSIHNSCLTMEKETIFDWFTS